MRAGLGKRKVPQFVRPRTTPPVARTWLPAVRAILRDGRLVGGTGWVAEGEEGSIVLFYFVDAAAGADLGGGC